MEFSYREDYHKSEIEGCERWPTNNCCIQNLGEEVKCTKKMRMPIMLFLIGLVSIPFVAKSVIAFQLQPEPPERILELLNELKAVIAEYVEGNPRLFTDTNTMQQANALYNKIDVVIGMVQRDNSYVEAVKKLGKDIAPKVNICETARIRALSWLSDDPMLDGVVHRFAGVCQGIISDILILMDQQT